MFGHGPMIVTLADVHMLTGLKITGPLQPYHLLGRVESKVNIPQTRGWGGDIVAHQGVKRSVSEYEHVSYLNMWLEKYLFCGSSCSPNANHLFLAECLA